MTLPHSLSRSLSLVLSLFLSTLLPTNQLYVHHDISYKPQPHTPPPNEHQYRHTKSTVSRHNNNIIPLMDYVYYLPTINVNTIVLHNIYVYKSYRMAR